MITVYRLLDPTTFRIRYIGQTTDTLKGRVGSHRYNSKRSKNHSACWIKSLTKKGFIPMIELITQVSTQKEADDLEILLIAFYRSIGCDLTNRSEGGKVNRGYKLSEEAKARISNTMRGRMLTPEHRSSISAARKGMKFPPETCANISASHIGKPNNFLGRTHTPEAKAKMSAAKIGNTNRRRI